MSCEDALQVEAGNKDDKEGFGLGLGDHDTSRYCDKASDRMYYIASAPWPVKHCGLISEGGDLATCDPSPPPPGVDKLKGVAWGTVKMSDIIMG
jgi:hypothetical protein